jgi:hypothetical protein
MTPLFWNVEFTDCDFTDVILLFSQLGWRAMTELNTERGVDDAFSAWVRLKIAGHCGEQRFVKHAEGTLETYGTRFFGCVWREAADDTLNVAVLLYLAERASEQHWLDCLHMGFEDSVEEIRISTGEQSTVAERQMQEGFIAMRGVRGLLFGEAAVFFPVAHIEAHSVGGTSR